MSNFEKSDRPPPTLQIVTPITQIYGTLYTFKYLRKRFRV
jgi:hypothetical protein